MIAISLQSGSNGNCVYVECGSTRLLVDAGISGLAAQRRLERHGRDIRAVTAVLISHDHRDHIGCAGVYSRKFNLPIHASPATIDAARRIRLGRIDTLGAFTPGDTLHFGDLAVETIPTPHDAADGAAFVVTDGHRRLGILTDLGHVFDGLAHTVSTLDAVFLESNYDDDMLRTGPYPWPLQQRIRGPRGHISNRESADLLHTAASPRLRWAVLSHLSEQNNHPHIALETHREIVSSHLPLHVASRYDASEMFTV
ncbi:MAG: MBL fold metallo-hydrolase [Phycisphaerae bacterium]|nr:MBL fold metallo-hydrolase [Phycisphaerae bacterium]